MWITPFSPGVIDTGTWGALGEQGKADYFARHQRPPYRGHTSPVDAAPARGAAQRAGHLVAARGTQPARTSLRGRGTRPAGLAAVRPRARVLQRSHTPNVTVSTPRAGAWPKSCSGTAVHQPWPGREESPATHQPPGPPGTGRWSPLPAAASACHSSTTSAASSTSPTPATSPPAGAAGPAGRWYSSAAPPRHRHRPGHVGEKTP
jgi:hypothetical protein